MWQRTTGLKCLSKEMISSWYHGAVNRQMNVSTAPGTRVYYSNPWHGGNSMGAKKKKKDISVITVLGFLTMLGNLSLNRHFGARTQLLSEHPNRRPSLVMSVCGSHTSSNAWHCLWYEITLFGMNRPSVIHVVCWIGLGCWWLFYPDHGMRLPIKGKCVRKWVSQCSGHLGEDSMDVYQVLEHAVSLTGAVSWLVVSAHSWVSNSEILDSFFKVAAHLLGIYLLLWSWFPSLWHGSSHLLWALKFLLFVGFTKLFWVYLSFEVICPSLDSQPFLVWFTGFSLTWER